MLLGCSAVVKQVKNKWAYSAINRGSLGRGDGDGQVVSVLAFFSDELCSNLAEVFNSSV